jgi:tRNA A37 methylthiotransferase MiaB
MINYFDFIEFYYYSDRKWTKSYDFDWKVTKSDMIKRIIYLRKFKEKYKDKIMDKNESLSEWIKVLLQRKY